MNQQISVERFKRELLECLEETFERHHGVYLDKGASLLPTLEGISAEEASRAVSENGATIAAHVEHARLYLEVLGDIMRTETIVKTNWREIWETVREISPEEWQASKRRLAESYERTIETIKNYDRWENEYGVGGAFGVLVHTAYHLGAIRQAATVIRSPRTNN